MSLELVQVWSVRPSFFARDDGLVSLFRSKVAYKDASQTFGLLHSHVDVPGPPDTTFGGSFVHQSSWSSATLYLIIPEKIRQGEVWQFFWHQKSPIFRAFLLLPKPSLPHPQNNLPSCRQHIQLQSCHRQKQRFQSNDCH